jgi:hypothetical protein
MTPTGNGPPAVAHRRQRSPKVRQAAAKMVVAANAANGNKTDPRIIAIAEGQPINFGNAC